MTVQHPCVVQTLGIFETPYDLFTIMELVNGGSLDRRMLSSELKYLQLVSNLIAWYRYNSDRDMGTASEKDLELCQVLDSVKLILRASYVRNEGYE